MIANGATDVEKWYGEFEKAAGSSLDYRYMASNKIISLKNI